MNRCLLSKLALIALCGFAFTGCSSSGDSDSTDTDKTIAEEADAGDTGDASEEDDASDENIEEVIYEDDIFKAVYRGVNELEGYQVLNVTLTNKYDGEITVYPDDSSVDGTMKLFTSGIPATMQQGKKFNQGWILGTEPVSELEFSMRVVDEDFSEIETVGPFTITVE